MQQNTQTHNGKQAYVLRVDAKSSQCDIPADVKQRDEIRRQTERETRLGDTQPEGLMVECEAKSGRSA